MGWEGRGVSSTSIGEVPVTITDNWTSQASCIDQGFRKTADPEGLAPGAPLLQRVHRERLICTPPNQSKRFGHKTE